MTKFLYFFRKSYPKQTYYNFLKSSIDKPRVNQIKKFKKLFHSNKIFKVIKIFQNFQTFLELIHENKSNCPRIFKATQKLFPMC